MSDHEADSTKCIELRANCRGQVLTRSDVTTLVAGQNRKATITSNFSDEWLNMEIYARFKPELGRAVDVSATKVSDNSYLVEVPHEATDLSGFFSLCFIGENSFGRIITTNFVNYTVLASLNGPAYVSDQETTSVYRELAEAADQAIQASKEAEQVTTSATEALNEFKSDLASGKYKGEKGDRGSSGAKGDTGPAATVTIGSVLTGAAGTTASVTNVGTSTNAILNFVIPRGDTGSFELYYAQPEYDSASGCYTNDSIRGWLNQNRNGKEYGIRVPNDNGTDSSCIKLGANANIPIPTTSTLASPGKDPYIDEGGPFRYMVACGGVDENGVPYCSGILGDSYFNYSPETDNVYSLTPIIWIKIESTDSYNDVWISDTWHPGYSLMNGELLPDGTLRPYMPYARYGLSIDAKGNARSVSGAKNQTMNVSHNSLITQCKNSSTGYSGKSSTDDFYVKLMFLMKYASKDSQKYFGQCAGYVFQYLCSVEETGVKRVVLTNAQAKNLIVGSAMQLGTNPSGANNLDRAAETSRDIFYDERITRIETYDDNHKSVYFDDVVNVFDTTISCLLSTSHWWSGACDGIVGDGSPTNCTNLTEPFVFQGIEVGYGFYEILGNQILSNRDGLGWDYYVNWDSRKESTGVTSDYEQFDLNFSGEGYGTKLFFGNGICCQSNTGGGSGSGNFDYVWIDKASTKGDREVLSLGDLRSRSYAGLWYVNGNNRLGGTWWSIGSRLSFTGRSLGVNSA